MSRELRDVLQETLKMMEMKFEDARQDPRLRRRAEQALSFIRETLDEVEEATVIESPVSKPAGAYSIGIATQTNNINEVRRLIKQGEDIEDVNELGATALINAAQFGYREIVKLLLESGANSNAKTRKRTTSLHVAADKGHTDVVQLLIDYHVDINAADSTGATPLFYSAQRGKLEIVKKLLGKKGIDLNKPNHMGATPLFIASMKGYTEIVKELLDAGADAKVKSWTGSTAYNEAVMNGHDEIAKMLKDRAMLNGENAQSSSPVTKQGTEDSGQRTETTEEEAREMIKERLTQRYPDHPEYFNLVTEENVRQVIDLLGEIEVVYQDKPEKIRIAHPLALVKSNKKAILQALEEVWQQEERERTLTGYFAKLSRAIKGDFVVQYSPERRDKPAASAAVNKVKVDVDREKPSNFTKFGKFRADVPILFRQDVDGIWVEVFNQPFPLAKGHYIMLPHMDPPTPQFLDKEAIKVALTLVKSRTYGEHFKVGFNSWRAWGSQNHLHLQALFYEDVNDQPAPMPVEAKKFVGEQIPQKGTVAISTLKDYPVNAFVFESENLEELTSVVLTAVQVLQNDNIAHNLIFTKTRAEKLKVYLFARKPQTPSKFGTGVAFFELAGEVIALIKDEADKVKIVAELQEKINQETDGKKKQNLEIAKSLVENVHKYYDDIGENDIKEELSEVNLESAEIGRIKKKVIEAVRESELSSSPVRPEPKWFRARSRQDQKSWRMAEQQGTGDRVQGSEAAKYKVRTTNDPSTSSGQARDVGGIDMNSIDPDRQGVGVDIQFDPVEFQQIIDAGIDGFAPVIINITPLPSVLPLLGLEPQRKEEELEVSSLN